MRQRLLVAGVPAVLAAAGVVWVGVFANRSGAG